MLLMIQLVEIVLGLLSIQLKDPLGYTFIPSMLQVGYLGSIDRVQYAHGRESG